MIGKSLEVKQIQRRRGKNTTALMKIFIFQPTEEADDDNDCRGNASQVFLHPLGRWNFFLAPIRRKVGTPRSRMVKMMMPQAASPAPTSDGNDADDELLGTDYNKTFLIMIARVRSCCPPVFVFGGESLQTQIAFNPRTARRRRESNVQLSHQDMRSRITQL